MRGPIVATALAVAFCAPGVARSQPNPLSPPAPHVIEFLDGHWSLLASDYSYTIAGETIFIPRGFVTDFASVPRKLQSVLGSHGRYSRAAIIHDFLYWAQPCTRQQSDNIMRLVMRNSGVPDWQILAVFKSVDWFGKIAWRDNAALRRRGVPHVVLPGSFALADRHTWEGALDVLVAAGVRDPQFSVSQSFCALGGPADATPSPEPAQ